MPAFGQRSSENLETCHRDLQRLFLEVVKVFDCSVIEGHRTQERQTALYNEDPPRTQVEWPNSKHNRQPSEAADVVPYPVDWNDTARFYYFAGYVKGVASQMGIKLIFGGDWNSDQKLKNESFKDLPHYELVLDRT